MAKPVPKTAKEHPKGPNASKDRPTKGILTRRRAARPRIRKTMAAGGNGEMSSLEDSHPISGAQRVPEPADSRRGFDLGEPYSLGRPRELETAVAEH